MGPVRLCIFTGPYRPPCAIAAITVFFGTLIGIDFGHYAAFTRETISVVCAFLYLGAERHADTAQCYFFWIFLPRVLPVKISDSSCIIIALIINASSYVAEVIRAGIQAVDKGQTEAAAEPWNDRQPYNDAIILPRQLKIYCPHWQ